MKAALYDFVNGRLERAGLAERRQELLEHAQGRVLEVGAGTGSNISHYPAHVEAVVYVEPDRALRSRLERRLAEAGSSATALDAQAEFLPFAAAEFHTVVFTLVLCTVPDQAAALSEARRVLEADGQLLFLEHVRSPDHRIAHRQDALDRPWWGLISGGCHCNRDTETAIRHAGFEIEQIERGALPKGPAIVRPMIVGIARR